MSILGSLGPLVQGSARGRTENLRTAAIHGLAFVAGATTTFTAAYALGNAVGIQGVPHGWRLGMGAVGLAALAVVDVTSLRASRYCPLGWSRQTPKSLARRHGPDLVAAIWGFDTGLAVTTFRVAAATWGALLLAVLGLAPWWAGVAYGLCYTVPLLCLLFRHPVGRRAREPGPTESGLGAMVGRRFGAQAASAVLLGCTSGLLVLRLAA